MVLAFNGSLVSKKKWDSMIGSRLSSQYFAFNKDYPWKQSQTLSFWAPKSLQMVIAAMKLKDAYSLEEVMTNLDSIFKSRDITLPTKAHLVKAMVFPVVMYGCESGRSTSCLSYKKLSHHQDQ